MINKDNAHFREGPDIGSKTLFLLEKGEVVSVQRITPSEFKVSIEVKLESSNKVVIMAVSYTHLTLPTKRIV